MPAFIPTCLAPPSLSWILSSVLKSDSAQKNPVSFNCYRCDKPGHLAANCPNRHDIRTWSVEEVKMALMVKKDMIKEEDPVEIKEVDLLGDEHSKSILGLILCWLHSSYIVFHIPLTYPTFLSSLLCQ